MPAAGEKSATDGFVELKHLVVARGAYPARLQAAWTAFAANHTDNDDPCAFGADQLYIVFVCGNGGKDLEAFRMRTFAEAQSLLLQVRARPCVRGHPSLPLPLRCAASSSCWTLPSVQQPARSHAQHGVLGPSS